jgi:hypothetical protein
MWSWVKINMGSQECERFRTEIEQAEGIAALSPVQKQHAAECAACQAVADHIATTRALLRDMPVSSNQPAPWFAPRVMAAIAARESELRRSLEAWAAVPRLAARLTWVSALALVLASTWLYASPKSAQQTSNTQATVESLFDATQSPAPDDILPPAERGE